MDERDQKRVEAVDRTIAILEASTARGWVGTKVDTLGPVLLANILAEAG